MSEAKQSRTFRPRRMARQPQAADAAEARQPSPAPRITKVGTVLELLRRPQGCSLDELIAATGWQPHTTRAALTGLKKKGHQLTSNKPNDGMRIYRIAAAKAGE